MGLSYEERLALRAHVSRVQRRRFWRESRMNLAGNWNGYQRSENTQSDSGILKVEAVHNTEADTSLG